LLKWFRHYVKSFCHIVTLSQTLAFSQGFISDNIVTRDRLISKHFLRTSIINWMGERYYISDCDILSQLDVVKEPYIEIIVILSPEDL
jgi:hypothetical protein